MGAADNLAPAAAAENVQAMFDTIAPRYDLMNHLLTGGVDHWWWWRAARSVRETLVRPESVIVDLCCGTGDMTAAMMRRRPSTGSTEPVLAVDFSHNMLLGGSKLSRMNAMRVEGDALHLPMTSNRADLITSAFGFRNLVDYSEGLTELWRVLKPGGRIAILECNQPEGLLGSFYNLYFRKILPRIGGLISDKGAYEYLPDSVERFPRPPAMLELMHRAGFVDASWTGYTFGVVGLYLATKK